MYYPENSKWIYIIKLCQYCWSYPAASSPILVLLIFPKSAYVHTESLPSAPSALTLFSGSYSGAGYPRSLSRGSQSCWIVFSGARLLWCWKMRTRLRPSSSFLLFVGTPDVKANGFGLVASSKASSKILFFLRAFSAIHWLIGGFRQFECGSVFWLDQALERKSSLLPSGLRGTYCSLSSSRRGGSQWRWPGLQDGFVTLLGIDNGGKRKTAKSQD